MCRFYECETHFFILGFDSANSEFALLEIARNEGEIEEHSVVSVPDLADDARYASCTGTVVGQAGAGKWLVRVTLKGGGTKIIATANVIYEGSLKWSVQQLQGRDASIACLKELEERFRLQGWLEHEHFDGIIGFARFTDQWCACAACDATSDDVTRAAGI
jgi:hypothetical protein